MNDDKPEILTPRDPAYDDVRALWNGMIDKRPAMIVRCRDRADVVYAVNLARRDGLPIAVRGGGHSVSGLSSCDGGVMIDLSLMRDVAVDERSRVASADPGARWSDYDAATHERGLASTGGLVSTTGVAGLTLGGGIGWLMRKHGLACDNLLAAELVTASGDVVRASSSENPELLWGLRGAGGNFGIVTKFRFRTHPVSTVLGGMMAFPLERGGDVLRAYREWAARAPDEFTTLVAVLSAPPAPFVPPEVVGTKIVAIVGCWCGDIDEGEALLQPLRALRPSFDVFATMPYPALQRMSDEGAPAGLRNYFRSGYAADLSDGFIDAVLDHGSRLPSPMSQVHVHHMGGAVARVGEDDTAFSNRRTAYGYNIVSVWDDANEDATHIAANGALASELAPFSSGGVYVNFLGDEGDARIRLAYGEAKYERLARLKAHFDPENVFKHNQNIRPFTT